MQAQPLRSKCNRSDRGKKGSLFHLFRESSRLYSFNSHFKNQVTIVHSTQLTCPKPFAQCQFPHFSNHMKTKWASVADRPKTHEYQPNVKQMTVCVWHFSKSTATNAKMKMLTAHQKTRRWTLYPLTLGRLQRHWPWKMVSLNWGKQTKQLPCTTASDRQTWWMQD